MNLDSDERLQTGRMFSIARLEPELHWSRSMNLDSDERLQNFRKLAVDEAERIRTLTSKYPMRCLRGWAFSPYIGIKLDVNVDYSFRKLWQTAECKIAQTINQSLIATTCKGHRLEPELHWSRSMNLDSDERLQNFRKLAVDEAERIRTLTSKYPMRCLRGWAFSPYIGIKLDVNVDYSFRKLWQTAECKIAQTINQSLIATTCKGHVNTPASDIRRNQINILLCGPPGHGKSSTGNSILGSAQFEVFSDGDTETTTVELKSTMYENYKVKLVDCPPAPREKPTNVREVFKVCASLMPQILNLCPKGLHAAVIVLKYGSRFYEEEGFVMAILKEVFGEKFIEDHCICVISNGDTFRKVVERSGSKCSPQDLNNWCRKQDPTSALGRIFTACKYRCVLFDNCTNDMTIKKEQIRQLMSMIVDSWPKTYLQLVVSVNPNMRIKADIHILIETASSLAEYQSQLKFVVNYTSSYKMSPDTAKVCVMIFGENEHVRFDFSTLKNHQQLATTLLGAPFLKPSAGTDKALKLARQESFSQSGGIRYGVHQMAVMLTEGHGTDERLTVEEADKLKSSGAEIIVVGVGNVYRNILEVIASEPTSVYIADTYDELQELTKEVAQKTAEKAPEFKSTADILFILDSSGSISPQDYQKELDFVVYLTECFNIGPNEVLFSVMVFSSDCQMLFDFTLTNHQQVMRQIKAAPHMEQSTDTAAALDLARTQAFTRRSGCRGGKKIAIIITDGCSNDMDETARAAEQLIDSGVLTLAVGVGDVNQTELECIATLPEDVYMVDNYSVLQTIQDELANKTCKLETAQRNRARRPQLPIPRTPSPPLFIHRSPNPVDSCIIN